ncbi:hypothetical protein [Aquimarina rubra]|uniref:DUF2269 family protein n=1 Tax=Aquimarina rubra TaxID=1920033 RepID=A0ABW5L948_9FLAO
MKKVLVYSGAVIALTIVGFVLYGNFINLSFLLLNKGEIKIFSNSMGRLFQDRLYFAISLGVIPLFYLWVRYFTNLNIVRQKILTYLLIIGGGILSWQCKIVLLNYRLNVMSKLNTQIGIDNSVSLERLDFDSYLLVGFAIGAIVSILVFGNQNAISDNL